MTKNGLRQICCTFGNCDNGNGGCNFGGDNDGGCSHECSRIPDEDAKVQINSHFKQSMSDQEEKKKRNGEAKLGDTLPRMCLFLN